MDILLVAIFVAYLPIQLAFLIAGLMFVIRTPRTKKRTALGMIFLLMFALMLSFTKLMATLAYMLFTGASFS